MKLSLHWLGELVDLKGLSVEKIGESLTLHTAEMEESVELKTFFKDVFTGKLVDIRPHKKADKLSVAQVDLGEKGRVQIIFGQVHEVSKGEILPIALGPTKLKSGLEIQVGEIRGERSEGMIADNLELGLKSPGLLRFPADTKLGVSLPELCSAFDDSILDIDNKSLTHRPDLVGHGGFARELGAIFNRKVTLPAAQKIKLPLPSGKDIPLEVQTKACRRACFLKLENVSVAPSDLLSQVRLEMLGVRSISNLVDITNLVMLGTGQPMHVFDADKIEGKFIIRQAKKGETLLALDGEEYELTPDDTVVADEKKVLSIAGIMGGEYSGVTERTKQVIFESACWDPTAVRKTSTRLGLRSDSSMRYEKSLDPEANALAVMLAAQMTRTACPKANIVSSFTDAYPRPIDPITIDLVPDLVRTHCGIDISDKEIQEKLTSIDFQVTKKGKHFSVKVPSFRATKDISIPEDLVEEVVRLHGFNDVPPTLPSWPIDPPRFNHLRALEWDIREVLAARGFLEVYNYSFVDKADQAFTGQSEKDYVKVGNPLSEEHTHLRTTLISNTIRHIESELRTHRKLDFFELGRVFSPSDKVQPTQTLRLALIKAEIGGDENEQFYKLKEDFLALLACLGVEKEVSFEPSEQTPPYVHPSKSADIVAGKNILGYLSVLHPQSMMVDQGAITFLELHMPVLLEMVRAKQDGYEHLSPFPSVHRDLSVVLPERTLSADLEKAAFQASDALARMMFFDEFRDEKKLGKGLKNLAFHLEFQSKDKTLEEQEIDHHFEAIVKVLKKNFGAVLRLEFDEKSKKS